MNFYNKKTQKTITVVIAVILIACMVIPMLSYIV